MVGGRGEKEKEREGEQGFDYKIKVDLIKNKIKNSQNLPSECAFNRTIFLHFSKSQSIIDCVIILWCKLINHPRVT